MPLVRHLHKTKPPCCSKRRAFFSPLLSSASLSSKFNNYGLCYLILFTICLPLLLTINHHPGVQAAVVVQTGKSSTITKQTTNNIKTDTEQSKGEFVFLIFLFYFCFCFYILRRVIER